MVWVVFALMTGAAMLCVLWPLGRTLRTRARGEADAAFYRMQLAEVDRDAARGLIAPAETELARAEVARRLFAAADERRSDMADAAKAQAAPRRRIAASFAIIAIPVVSIGLYMQLGSPDLPDAPLEARLQADPAHMDPAVAIARIEDRLAKHPNDADSGRGYELLARLYLGLGRADDAVKAYARSIELLGDSPERRESYGEALVMAANGTVTADARSAFEAALAREPSRPKSRFYLGIAAAQAGDGKRAAQIFTKLVEDFPDAPWAGALRSQIAALQGRAGQELQTEEAAAIGRLPPADQEAAIRGMVDRLAARLAQDGHDADGWLRLVRAYAVIKQDGKARTALADARRSLAGDAGALARLDDLARELGLGGS